MEDFSGKSVLVTGAAGNLGTAVARAFLQRDATLVLFDKHKERCLEAFGDLRESPKHVIVPDIDLTSEQEVDRAVDKISSKLGTLDVLVNTVGGYKAGLMVEDTDLATWEFMLNLNARTTFLMSRAVIPLMKKRGSGSIVSISTLAAIAGKPGMAAYIISKSAVIRLTESMSEELRPFNINVNVILPNSIDTPENRAQNPQADFSTWVTPAAIAEVIVFLASPAGRAVHGASIPVRGSG